MTDKEANRFITFENGTDIWAKLVIDYGMEEGHNVSKTIRLQEIRTEYHSKVFDSSKESIKEHLDVLEIHKDDLIQAGEDTISEKSFIERVLSSIKEQHFEDLIKQIRFLGDAINRTSYIHLRATLGAAIKSSKSKPTTEERKTSEISNEKKNEKLPTHANASKVGVCSFCEKPGHQIEQCIAMKNSKQRYQQAKQNYNNNNQSFNKQRYQYGNNHGTNYNTNYNN